jgi:TRAP-type C4-dicarboxylate transport system substrate-binding protein
VIRLASVAPEGSAWAREFHSFAEDAARRSGGDVVVKPYYNGVQGDDLQSIARVQREQIEGVVSAGLLCEQLAPSMRVLRLLGAFRTFDESRYVREKLAPVFDEEFRRSGYVNLGYSGLGAAVLFSRVPVRSIADARHLKLWIWDIDQLARQYAEKVKANTVRLPVEEVALALDDGRIEALFAIPSAALAFRWFPRLRYVLNLPIAFFTGCVVVDARVFERLSPRAQDALKVAAARFTVRVEEIAMTQDQLTLAQFKKQGIEPIDPPESLRSEWFETYLKAREQVGDQLVPIPLVRRVIALLTSYRARPTSP